MAIDTKHILIIGQIIRMTILIKNNISTMLNEFILLKLNLLLQQQFIKNETK